MNWKRVLGAVLLILLVLLAAWLFLLYRSIDVQLDARRGEPFRVAILDPLCGPLARDETRGRERDYAPLGPFLEEKLGRPVELAYGRHLGNVLRPERPADLIIGRSSAILAEAETGKVSVRPIARLTDDGGVTDIFGRFVVRADDPARTIGDLADHRIVFGPADDEERHASALATLAQHGVTPVPPLRVEASGREAIRAVVQRQTDTAVVSSYAPVAADGGTADNGSLREVGRTVPQPFITAFVTDRTGPAAERVIASALLSAAGRPPLLAALRSKAGFVPLENKPTPTKDASTPPPVAPWTDWRGPDRAGISPAVPARLPSSVKFLWKRGLTGAGLSGVAATATHVIVADKSEQKDQDIWRCLDADTGKELWTVAYATPKQMEFTNVPRATPVIHGSFVYLLGAFGDLHCVSLHGSGIVWHRNILTDFGAKLPTWGTCSTPLVVGDCLIVNPGAADAALVALGLYTGEVIWKTPGAPPAYGSLILGTFGGVRQIVGHDAGSLGGWDPNTGQRLWTLIPDKKGDYNVPTPVDLGGRLLVATENNGTRLYDFDPDGRIRPTPVARNVNLAPDTSTPVVVAGLVFGCSRGLFCLDAGDGLKTLYSAERDGAFREHAAFIAGNGRVLAATVGGELILWEASRGNFTPTGRLQVFDGAEVWSHPALVGDRLYLRSMNEICCILLRES